MAQNFPIAEKFRRLLHAHVAHVGVYGAPRSNPPNLRMHLNVANNFYSPEKQFQNQLTKVSNYKQAASSRWGQLAFKIGEGEGAAVLKYGTFIQNTVDFIIVAFCIFLMLKGINKLNRKKEEPAAPAAPAGPTQEELLAEIRDLLKNK